MAKAIYWFCFDFPQSCCEDEWALPIKIIYKNRQDFLNALTAHSQNWDNFFVNWKPFKNDEKILFHLKSSFCSQDI